MSTSKTPDRAKKKPPTKAALKYIDKYEDSLTNYRVIKTSLSSIIKNNDHIGIINEVVSRVNRIVIHTYQFIKLYILYNLKYDKPIPIISKRLVDCVMKLIYTKNVRGAKTNVKTNSIIAKLKTFFDDQYYNLIPENDKDLRCTNIMNILNYEQTSIVTCFHNHIMNNFYNFFNRFINVIYEKDKKENDINDKLDVELNNSIKDLKKSAKRLVNNFKAIKKEKYNNSILNHNKHISDNKDIDNKSKEIIINEYNRIKNNELDKEISVYTDKIYNKYLKDLKIVKSDITKLKKDQIRALRSDIQKLKTDLLNKIDVCPASNIVKKIKTYVRKDIFPKLVKSTKIHKRVPVGSSVNAYVNADPLSFLHCMIKMSQKISEMGEKTFSCFPLRRNISPKYIKLDATALARLFIDGEFNGIKNRDLFRFGNIIKNRDDIFKHVFKTEKDVFSTYENTLIRKNANKQYVFNNEVCTDGKGCSILQVRKDKYDPRKQTVLKSVSKPFGYVSKNDMYLEDLPLEKRQKLSKLNVAAIDPNKDDLMFVSKIVTNEHDSMVLKPKIVTWRYTQNQRRKETLAKKYRNRLNKDKKDTHIYSIIDGERVNNFSDIDFDKQMTVQLLESMLSTCDFKQCTYDKALSDIRSKNIVNGALSKYYEKELHRQIRFYKYINKQRSEANMINSFKVVMGPPGTIFIAFGDYSPRTHMRYKEPAKCKGFRRLFRIAGYEVYLIDEYNTSAKAYPNGEDTETFRKRGSPRPQKKIRKTEYTDEVDKRKKYTYRVCHGLLRFKNDPNNKPANEILYKDGVRYNRLTGLYKKMKTGGFKPRHTLINRDVNSTLNIRTIAICHVNDIPIPDHFRRT